MDKTDALSSRCYSIVQFSLERMTSLPMKEAENLEPIENGNNCTEYFVTFHVQTIEEESDEENDDFDDNNAELHQ